MKKVLLISLVLVLGLVGNGLATTITGSISGPTNGLYGSDGWSDAVFSWRVTDPDQSSSGYWEYVYTFSDSSKSISHLIIQVSDEFTLDNLFDGTTLFGEDGGLGWYSDDDGKSNPGLPELIHGIKWNTSDDPLTFSVTIITDKEPMDGNFYAKDGRDKKEGVDIDVYAWSGTSTGFGDNILVPDTNGGGGGGNGVPEPSTIILLGAGLFGLGLFGKRNFNK